MTLADIQIRIKNQVAKIEEQQKALLDSQKELSVLLEERKVIQQLAYKRIKEAVDLLKEAQSDLEFTTEEIINIAKSEIISSEVENEIDMLEKYNQYGLVLGSIDIELEKSEFTATEGQEELVNAITEKLEDFEFALSRLPGEERDYAKLKLQNIIGDFLNH
ncbi:MAG: hypothetical protein ACKPA8_11055 [Dolichospermum sp.]